MKNIMNMQSRTWLTGITLCMVSLVGLHCIGAPSEPIAPASEIQLSIPLIDITRTFLDFTAKDTLLKRDPATGTYSYITSQAGQPMGIDTIKAQPQPSAQQTELGQFTISSIPTTSQSFSLADLGVSPIVYPGATPPFIPPFQAPPVSLPGQTLDFTSQFGYVAISSGSITLRVTNNLPLKMTYTKPIILRNNKLDSPIDTSAVAVFDIGTVDSFTTVSRTASLDGKILQGLMKTDSIVFSTAERSDPFSLTNSHGVSFSFSSTALVADSATAVIPDQTVYSINNSTFTVDDTVAIREARFSKGRFNIVLTNQLDISVSVFVEFLEFKSLHTGNNFALNTTLNSKSVRNLPVSFDSIRVSTPTSNPFGTKITYSVGINTITSVGIKKTVTKNDFVRAEIQPVGEVVVKEITGKIKPMGLPIFTAISAAYQLGESKDKFKAKLQFRGIVLDVHLPLTGGFPTDYNLTFIAKNTARNFVDSIILPPVISTGLRRIEPNVGKQTIQISGASFDEFLNGLGKFFPELPDSFYIRGTMTINPNDVFVSNTNYTISDTTKIYPSFDLTLPLDLGIQDGQLVEVSAVENKGLMSKDFTKNVGKGTVNFLFTNRMPVQLAFKMAFLQNNITTNRIDTLFWIIPTNFIAAAGIDQTSGSTNGYAINPMESKVSVSLSGQQMEWFSQADSVMLRLDLNTSNGGTTPVRMRSSDYIRVRASGNMIYTINKP